MEELRLTGRSGIFGSFGHILHRVQITLTELRLTAVQRAVLEGQTTLLRGGPG